MTGPAAVTAGMKAGSDVVSRPLRNGPQGRSSRWLVLDTWARMGTLSAALAIAIFFADLLHAGWRPGSPVGVGSPLHAAYREATIATFIAVIASQLGAATGAWAAPTSPRRIEVAANPAFTGALLLGAVLFFAAPAQRLVAAGALHAWVVVLLAACPATVWAALIARRRHGRSHRHPNPPDAGEASGDGRDCGLTVVPREGRAQ